MRALAALCLALLAGCTTVGPDYERPATGLPDRFPAGSAGEPAIREDWWTLYDDPLLDSLVASAQESNADARLAAARVLEAEALWREADAAFLPEVTGAASGTRNRVSTRTLPPQPAGVPTTRSTYALTASASF